MEACLRHGGKWGALTHFLWAWICLHWIGGESRNACLDHYQRTRLRSMGMCLTTMHGISGGILACIGSWVYYYVLSMQCDGTSALLT